jgi:hypothetical protein
VDYETPRSGIRFRFFRKDLNKPFDHIVDGGENFRIGIETKWVTGHEHEKMPQIRDRYYQRGFELIAVVGFNVETWKRLITDTGHFANYYLFVPKEDELSLDQVIQSQPLLRACDNRRVEEMGQSLVGFLRSKQAEFARRARGMA